MKKHCTQGVRDMENFALIYFELIYKELEGNHVKYQSRKYL